jgi:hypothetical protein
MTEQVGHYEVDPQLLMRSSQLRLKDQARKFLADLKKPERTIYPGKVYRLVGNGSAVFYVAEIGPHPLSRQKAAYGTMIDVDGETTPNMVQFSQLGDVINL